VFALCGRYAMWAVHALALVVVVATAFALAAIARHLGSRRAGVLAGIGYGVFTTVYYPKMLAANTEVFMMGALAGAMWLVWTARRRWHWLAAGALVAVACAFKQTAGATLLVALAGAFAARDRGRPIALVAAGFTAMLVLEAAIIARTSSLADLWLWTVTRLGAYGSSAWTGGVWRKIAVGFLPFVAASLLAWVAAAAAAPRWREQRLLWAWFAMSMATAVAGGQFFGHYFIQPLAPLVVIAALELDRRWDAPRVRFAATALVAIPAAAFFAFNLAFEPLTEAIGDPDPDFREPVAWIREHTRADDRIFVWGNFAPMYVLADRLPATRFVGFLRGAERDREDAPVTNWDVGPEVWQAVAEDFALHPPVLVVDTSSANYMSFGRYSMQRFPELAALVRDYREVAIVDGVTMYLAANAAAAQ
jgi:hypothetical protein